MTKPYPSPKVIDFKGLKPQVQYACVHDRNQNYAKHRHLGVLYVIIMATKRPFFQNRRASICFNHFNSIFFKLLATGTHYSMQKYEQNNRLL